METALVNLVARDSSESTLYDPTMTTLLIVLLVLIIVALLAMMGLYYMRYRRRLRGEHGLPTYNEKRSSSSRSHHRRLTIRPSESIYVYQEKQHLIENSYGPPTSPVPEIRITFPEELDNSGKRQSGKVVVVHVGESGVGLEPVSDEKLPSYQQTESDRFQSLDLDRIGGLKEKDLEASWR